ncbi:MAG TPA: hypothetical protein GXZ85_11365 [Firmicutes bacterium]|nr:hypothetical protein [Bacillota bacterium]
MKINLLPKEERPLKQSAVRPEFIIVLLGLLLLGAALYGAWQESLRMETLTTSIHTASLREKHLHAEAARVSQIRQELAVLEAREAVYRDLLTQEDESALALAPLVEHSFPNLWIEGLRWDVSKIELGGYTTDMTSVSRYLNYLNERSEEVHLRQSQLIEGTNFIVFRLEVEGVRAHGQSELD